MEFIAEADGVEWLSEQGLAERDPADPDLFRATDKYNRMLTTWAGDRDFATAILNKDSDQVWSLIEGRQMLPLDTPSEIAVQIVQMAERLVFADQRAAVSFALGRARGRTMS